MPVTPGTVLLPEETLHCPSVFFFFNVSLCVFPQVQCYDPESDSWLLRANIPIAKRCITAVSLNNLIYVSGGLTKSIYCYDPTEDYWMHVVHTFSKQVLAVMKLRFNMLQSAKWICL